MADVPWIEVLGSIALFICVANVAIKIAGDV